MTTPDLSPSPSPDPSRPPAIPVTVNWAASEGTSATVLTTHLWAAPPLKRDSPIHGHAFKALRELKADYVRFLPWFSHPTISVAALEPPTATETFWNFEQLDPFVEDFIEAAEGRPVVANFATIPAWMFTTPVGYSELPDVIHWDYENGTEFRDPSLEEVAEYFFRLASWYIAGGFTDELGVFHESGHHYRFAFWEVLCEPDLNHKISPQIYNRLYDAVVERIATLDPDMKFIGLSLSHLHHDPEYFWEFLDESKHQPGIPLDAFSYHFYASPDIVNPFSEEGNDSPETWRSTFFAQADAFMDQVKLIDSIKSRLSPDTQTFLNEVGTYPADVMNPEPQIPQTYWALSASVHAYLWSRCSRLGIDLFGVAEFMDYPGMIPGTTLIDWTTGMPNARYRVTKLLLDHFGSGDTFVESSLGYPGFPDARLHIEAIRTPGNDRKLLLINKRDGEIDVDLGDDAYLGGTVECVDATMGQAPAQAQTVQATTLTLKAHATAVLTMPRQ